MLFVICLALSFFALVRGECTSPLQYSSCIDLGISYSYNAIVFSDLSGYISVEGKLAVGGNARFSNNSFVGKALTQINCTDYVSVINGYLFWSSGSNYNGNIAVGDACSVVNVNVLQNGCSVYQKQQIFDFAGAFSFMRSLSLYLSSFPCTTTSDSITADRGISLSFSNSPMELFEVPSPDFFATQVKYINIVSNIIPQGLLIFNFMDANVTMDSFSNYFLKEYNVIFNFPHATSIIMKQVSIWGTVVAPKAVVQASGTIYGSIYVNSLSGSLSVFQKDFSCLSGAPNAANPTDKVSCRQVGNNIIK